MSGIKSYEDLEVWKKAHQFVLDLYKDLDQIPKCEDFNIKNQIKRAAISIPTNIAEGSGRRTTKEYIQYLVVARGSCEECKYLLHLSKDLTYLDDNTYSLLRARIVEIGKMLNGLISVLTK